MPNRKKFFDQPIQITAASTSVDEAISSSKYTAPGGMQLPFATGSNNFFVSTTTTGAPARFINSSFGSTQVDNNLTLTNATNYPSLSGTFSAGTNNMGCYFVMPCDAVVKTIKIVVTVNGNSFTPSATIYPFVGLATATNANENTPANFTFLTETQTISTRPLIWSDFVSRSITLSGETNVIDTVITEGTLVSIICGIFQTDHIGTTQSTSGLSYSGVIQFI